MQALHLWWGQSVYLALFFALIINTASDGQDFPPTPVVVTAVLERHVSGTTSLVGTVRPRRQSRVASEVAGQVVERLCDAGQKVGRGTPLFRLDNNQVRAQLIEALADVKLRRFDQEQSLKLWRQEALAEQQLRQDEYELDRARAKLQDLESQMHDLIVRAPFAGHIVQTFTELGEWVDRGAEIADLISIDTVRVYVDVPEKYIARLALRDTTQVFVDALDTTPFTGRIVAIFAQGRPQSHTFPVVVEVPNLNHRIRANMAARGQFALPHDQPLLLVHKDAVVNSPMGQVVYLAIDDKAVSRPLQTGQAHNGYVAVEGDVQPGDLAIVRGNERLRDSQPIQVIRKQQ